MDQHCIHCLLAIPNQSFPHSSKVWCCRWVEHASDTLLNQMFCNLLLVPCCYILCRLFFSSNELVPLLLIILTGFPLRAMNRLIAFRQQSVSSFGAISKCTARTVRHLKRQHQPFLFLQPIYTVIGLKMSTLTFENTVDATDRSLGRSSITGAFVWVLLFRHLRRLFLINLKAFRMHRIQNFC